MSCALDIIVKLFSLSLLNELVIQLQVARPICILDTILMRPEFVPSLGRWQLLGSLSFVLQCRDVIYILNGAMDCKNNKNELTASGS